VLGIVGTFGILDLSISTSFIKFISEYYNQKKTEELNNFINTGFGLYFVFSLLLAVIGYIFSGFFISLINVPPELVETGIFALRISLVIFFITTSFTIFISILISLQKIYLSSVIGIALGCLNLALTILFLYLGWGLAGVMLCQLLVTVLNTIITVMLVKKYMPEVRMGVKYLNRESLRKMFGFGIQIQVSKMSTFAVEKYDEFLLGFFSVLSSVTYYNLAGRILKLGRFIPFQIYAQIAPVAAELNARHDEEKLDRLFSDATRYLTVISVPIFTFIYFFADLIVFAWMGERYDVTVYFLKILLIGQIINMSFSAPGNAILPNIGIPKYMMYEGLINLCINLMLSFLLIKYYGILGAAFGNTIAVAISSFYVFYVSMKFYKRKFFIFFYKEYLIPILIGFVSGIISFYSMILIEKYYNAFQNRFSAFVVIFTTGVIFSGIFSLLIFKANYLKERDKDIFRKLILIMSPLKEKKQ
jgi:O-antigen/teichoic acid export membrane protein